MYLISAMVFGMGTAQTINSIIFPEQGDHQHSRSNQVDVEHQKTYDDGISFISESLSDTHSSISLDPNARLSTIPR